MAQVVWSEEALANIDAIERYVAEFNPSAARRLGERLRDAGGALEALPERGRPAGGDARLLLTIYPYVIRYVIRGDTVIILRVRHAARRVR